MNNQTDISVVLVAHHERHLLYRSLRSLKRCQNYAQGYGVKTELIVVMNDTDPETLEMMQRWKETFLPDKIVLISFDNLGEARHAGIDQARGDYVALADADDLFSNNWLYESFITLKTEGPKVIVHPEYNLLFGNYNVLYHLPNQQDPSTDIRDLLFNHLWSSLIVTDRSLFNKLRFTRLVPASGFGYEDWLFNCQAIILGYTHITAKRTVLFYRRTESSLSTAFLRDNSIIPDNDFFEDERIFYSHYSSVQTFEEQQSTTTNDLTPVPVESIPDWIVEDMRQECDIEPLLFPSSHRLQQITNYYKPPHSEAEKNLYGWLLKQWPKNEIYTHVIILPWFIGGGAEKIMVNYAQVLANELKQRVLFITTSHVTHQSPLCELYPTTKIINLGQQDTTVTDEEKETVLLRCLVQRRPGVIQVVGSSVGWQLFRDHGLKLRQHSRLFVTGFSNTLTDEGEQQSIFWDNLEKVIPHLSGITTDNQYYRELYLRRFGFPKDFMNTIYTPYDRSLIEYRRSITVEQLRSKQVLWASRLTRGKRVDILGKVARRLPTYCFWAYGEPSEYEQSTNLDELSKIPNIHLMGGYKKFSEILRHPYSLFLYTSDVDGLPNVLLEATTVGLPVVAPNIGGIKELINDETGYLVDDYNNVEEYCRLIMTVGARPVETQRRVQNAINLLEARHSHEQFSNDIKSVPNYLIKLD